MSCQGDIQAGVTAGCVHMQAELDRDTDTLKKEVLDIRLLAQRDTVLDPEADMAEVLSGLDLLALPLEHGLMHASILSCRQPTYCSLTCAHADT